MHAVIEKSLRNKVVQAPSEWPTILRNARLHPEPYVIINKKYSDFLDFKSLTTECSSSKLKISEIKKATFYKSNYDLKIKYSFCDSNEDTVFFKLKSNSKPKNAYKSELQINKMKYDNLKTLCETHAIKPEYHYEYLTLKTSPNIPDVLNETDCEDNTE